MYEKGIAPLIILIIIAGALAAGVVIKNSTNNQSTQPSPTPTSSGDSSTSPSSTSTPSSTTKATAKATAKPTATPKTSSATCSVNALSGSSSMAVNFIYGANYSSSQSVSAAQWDFDGNGTWDTDMSSSNLNTNHTYSQNGKYYARLQLKMSDGLVTSVCNKEVNIPFSTSSGGVTVSWTGKTYRDENCNATQDINESGVGGATVNFIKLPEYSLHSTTTSDGSGNYNLSATIPVNDSLNIKASAVAPSGYKINYTPPEASLNSTQKTINKNLPLVPNENIGLCSTP